MHFLWANVTFYDAVIMIYDVIGTANPFLYRPTAKLMLVDFRNNRTKEIER